MNLYHKVLKTIQNFEDIDVSYRDDSLVRKMGKLKDEYIDQAAQIELDNIELNNKYKYKLKKYGYFFKNLRN